MGSYLSTQNEETGTSVPVLKTSHTASENLAVLPTPTTRKPRKKIRINSKNIPVKHLAKAFHKKPAPLAPFLFSEKLSKRTSTTFSKVPPEVRVLIFQYCVTEHELLPEERGNRRWTMVTPALVKALRWDQELYNEALALWYGQNKFILSNRNYKKMDDLSPSIFPMIKDLQISMSDLIPHTYTGSLLYIGVAIPQGAPWEERISYSDAPYKMRHDFIEYVSRYAYMNKVSSEHNQIYSRIYFRNKPHILSLCTGIETLTIQTRGLSTITTKQTIQTLLGKSSNKIYQLHINTMLDFDKVVEFDELSTMMELREYFNKLLGIKGRPDMSPALTGIYRHHPEHSSGTRGYASLWRRDDNAPLRVVREELPLSLIMLDPYSVLTDEEVADERLDILGAGTLVVYSPE